jgi:fibro-slime domain-containing protein
MMNAMQHRVLVALSLTAGLVACDCGDPLGSGRDGDARVGDARVGDARVSDARIGDAARGDAAIGIDGGVDCTGLRATLRDFRADHPDFEAEIGSMRGLVEDMLGADFLPIYAPSGPTAVTAGQMEFDQWYRDVDGVNMRFEIPIPLTETSPGVFVFDDPEFFPLDGMGWPGEETLGHNFHFTTEIHAGFTYRGGEVFTFRGDDDVFLFINSRLALDLGGVHGPETGMVDFDARAAELGITPGGTYRFDIFHAERHTSQSNFRLETSIECFVTLI